ncbi:GPI transamidase component PIG-S [Impatiens glandulifera]|uniref:GPI transamidase component PIG-S n=1 Tax=Impatiens glandulifera TaxID=253017 RepID=UPI001FB0C036|nr:GPI transamidase component PIG-S [Impatiens glandulifera]
MAEISAAPDSSVGSTQAITPEENTSTEASETSEFPSDFDPETMRKTKPGLKRLILALSVLFSFLLGIPFLLNTIEIYRAPLPFRSIDTLSKAVESNPLAFPCRFEAVFIGFHSDLLTDSSADELGFSIIGHMRKYADDNLACGTCGNNYTVSVTVDSSTNCTRSQNSNPANSWKCGSLHELNSDDKLIGNDDYLEDFFKTQYQDGGKVYTVIVINKNVEIRSVVGKYRQGWIIGKLSEADAVEKIAEIFVKIFVNGGKEEPSIHGEFMPVGADGRIVLSFNLLNADPKDWIYDWDFHKVDDVLLSSVIEALGPIANISVESQVLYHTPKSSFSHWNDELQSYVFSTNDLPFFVNSNEWHLDTSITAGGRSKILHIVVYVPSANECPLLLQLPNGEISKTNAFVSPMWGGVIVWNPPGCSRESRNMHSDWHMISDQDLQKVFEVFLGQFRQLLDLKSENSYTGTSGTITLLPSNKGFTEWEVDVLSRQHTCFNIRSCATTLGSLSRLVRSLPRMIIMDEIGKQVESSLEAATSALGDASLGKYKASAMSSREARSLAEDAFFHPSIMSVSYFSFEHCFAVYSPFFLPVSLHVILAAARELRRFRKEKLKYLKWTAHEKQK